MKRFVVLISNYMYRSGNYLNTWKVVVAPDKAQAFKIAWAYDRLYPCGVDRDKTIILVDTLSASKAKAVARACAPNPYAGSSLHELNYVIKRNVRLRMSAQDIKFVEWLESIRD